MRFAVLLALSLPCQACSVAALFGAPIPCASDDDCPPAFVCVETLCSSTPPRPGEGEPEDDLCPILTERFDDEDTAPFLITRSELGSIDVEGGELVIDLTNRADLMLLEVNTARTNPFVVTAVFRGSIPQVPTQAWLGAHGFLIAIHDGVVGAREPSDELVIDASSLCEGEQCISAGGATEIHVRIELDDIDATHTRVRRSFFTDKDATETVVSEQIFRAPAARGFVNVFGQAYEDPPFDPPAFSWDDIELSGPCPDNG